MPALPPSILALALAGLLAAAPVRADTAAELRAAMSRGDLPAALQLADQALRAKPQDANLRFLRGVVLMDLRRDELALEAFQQVSQQHPELPDPYNNIALLHARAGRLDSARLALEAALRSDPGHRAARINLGQVHLMLAARAFEQAAANGSADAELQRKLEALQSLLQSAPAAAGR